MNKPYPFSEINTVLASAQHISILLSENPNFDLVASGLGLFLSLNEAGKKTTIIASTPMRVEFSHLVGVDKISEKIDSGKDLIISIDYSLDNVEKVSYDDKKGKVNLIVQPKNGLPPIAPDKVSLSQPGQEIDLYFLLGGKNLNEFGVHTPVQKIQNSQNILIHQQSVAGGKIQFADPAGACYSEITTAILVSLSLPSNQDIAQNLYLGLSHATANFTTQNVSADTFEAAALCLRAGAIRNTQTVVQANQEIAQEKIVKTKDISAAPSPDWLQPKIYRGASTI